MRAAPGRLRGGGRCAGPKLGALLVQLPPKLAFDSALVQTFFEQLRARTQTALACEPRPPSWFTIEADKQLDALHVARVAADPACCDNADAPGGWRGFTYWRLHGSPVKYRSSYADRLAALAGALTSAGASGDAWCIFDNTASSAAAGNALALMARLQDGIDG